jgi:hypothetical protein
MMRTMAAPRESQPDEEPTVDLRAVAYALFFHGRRNREIAEALGRSEKTISDWLNKAALAGLLDRPPSQWAFGLRLDHSLCETNPIKPGERLVCVVCCASGWDHHPLMHSKPLPRDRKPPRADGLMGGVT